jgi:E1-E2 ATPase
MGQLLGVGDVVDALDPAAGDIERHDADDPLVCVEIQCSRAAVHLDAPWRQASESQGLRPVVLVPVKRLHVRDTFVVRRGEKVATDGVVKSGSSAVGTSMLIGEPVPVEVARGDEVTNSLRLRRFQPQDSAGRVGEPVGRNA